MAACNDYLLRAYVPSRVRSRDLDAYVAAEFGIWSRGWFLAEVAGREGSSTRGLGIVAVIRNAWARLGQVEQSEAPHEVDARRVRGE